MADYQVLSQDEQDDIVVSFMLSQERDKFCHELNLGRYDSMLPSLPDGEWKARVTDLRSETANRLAEINSIIEASKKGMPPAARLEAAKLRLQAKATQ
ncbi:hypothetical protein ES703_61739 [subsurface metagenome]